ncbi:DUF1543 domain-containing protein [Flavobacterium sp. ZS1P70]|uniref:DUF1543 domain-containing protein n=1 Tax=Flavobacterium zhoui TaxID=3230414 RepID=A0ABW6I4L8_9FLAO
MEEKLKLYMVMLGCTPKGRLTEQHDIFFGIGNSLKNLVSQMKKFWPEAKGKIHIDAWREVSAIENFSIKISAKDSTLNSSSDNLFFINLGGYKENEFKEYHYKILTVAESMGLASKKARRSTFYKLAVSREPLRTSTTNTGLMWMIFIRYLIYCLRQLKNYTH